MRIIHRNLGFFLGGIMAVYAISGVLMIFRNTDFLKKEVLTQRNVPPNLSTEELRSTLKLKGTITTEDNLYFFKQGTYDKESGVAFVSKQELPTILKKMENLHKATTDSPLYWLNIFFGVSLLFFVISAFWMFLPSTSAFKKGLYFSLAGIILTLILLLV